MHRTLLGGVAAAFIFTAGTTRAADLPAGAVEFPASMPISDTTVAREIMAIHPNLPAPFTQKSPTRCYVVQNEPYDITCDVELVDANATGVMPDIRYYLFPATGGFDYITKFVSDKLNSDFPGTNKIHTTDVAQVSSKKTGKNTDHRLYCFQALASSDSRSYAVCVFELTPNVIVAAEADPPGDASVSQTAPVQGTPEIEEASLLVELGALSTAQLSY